MSTVQTFPLSQAAFVLREPIDEVRRTIERRQVEYHLVRHGGRKVRAVDLKTLVFLNWTYENHEDLKPSLWSKLYKNLSLHTELPSHIESGDFRASLDQATKRVKKRLETLQELEKQIRRTEEGNVVLKGTDIEVHRIEALLKGGMPIDEIVADYPSLTRDQIAFAQTYATAHPKPGRPYPKLTAKAALRQVDFSSLSLDD